MKMYYNNEVDTSILEHKKICVIGYGSQGHAHANNLHDSGMKVTVGLRERSLSVAKAKQAGLNVADVKTACEDADLVMVLSPDEHQAKLYKEVIADALKPGAALFFAHGFNIHYGFIEPRSDIDVAMVAPKGPGHLVRSSYVAGGGVPCLIAVAQNASGHALELAKAYAVQIGGGRSGIIETTFKEETETDLFGEQAVLCGGLTELMRAGFEVLVEAGYAPEMAYFECVHELKLIVDLLYEGGMNTMFYSVSNTAEYGALVSGKRVIDPAVKERMREVLADVCSGAFARRFMQENEQGGQQFERLRDGYRQHPIEAVGAKLRAMMPWIESSKVVDQKKSSAS